MSEISREEAERRASDDFFGTPKIRALFTLQPVADPAKTAELGYPAFKEQTYVMVVKEGEVDHISVAATKDHVNSFPRDWKLFQEKLKNPRIPLTVLPGIRPGVIQTFRQLGIDTVDALVAAPIKSGPLVREIVVTDEMLTSEDDYLADVKPICAVPPALAKWRDIAMHYIVFRAKVEGKPVPALRLVGDHWELASTVAPALAVVANDIPDPFIESEDAA